MAEEGTKSQTAGIVAQIDLAAVREAVRGEDGVKVLQMAYSLCMCLRETRPPKEYYEFYLVVLDGLMVVSDWLLQTPAEQWVYEMAQFGECLIPRLYVFVTVGIRFYRSTPDPGILEDILDMIKGAQHSIKGLFLRYYLSKNMKNLHKENSFESAMFVIHNLAFMNTLWAKIENREERENLKVTVGENVEQLSAICTDLGLYLENVFPSVVEILKNSDEFSQQYLLDCLVQAFPDVFLMNTCEQIIQIACEIQPRLDVVELVLNSLSRLLRYLSETNENLQPSTLNCFQCFLALLPDCNTDFSKVLELHSLVMKFSNDTSIGCKNALNCLQKTAVLLDDKPGNENYSVIFTELLVFPLKLDIDFIVSSEYNRIFFELDNNGQRIVATSIIDALETCNSLSERLEFWQACFEYLQTLSFTLISTDKQLRIIKILHRLRTDCYELYECVFHRLCETEIIVLSLCFLCLKNLEKQERFSIIAIQCINKLANPYISAQLCVSAITIFDRIQLPLDDIYDKAIIEYDKIMEIECKISLLYCMIGCINRLKHSSINTDRIVELCYKLQKKSDQCLVLLSLGHIFWSKSCRNPKNVLDNLKRAVKLADLCVTGTKNMSLFVFILNAYLNFFVLTVPSIEISSINSLIELIFELLSFQSDKEIDLPTKQYLTNTIRYIKLRQTEEPFSSINTEYKAYV
jgi:hypothetical protein